VDEVHLKLYIKIKVAGYIPATSVINKYILPISGSTPTDLDDQLLVLGEHDGCKQGLVEARYVAVHSMSRTSH
jgi:hypothetical protein